MYDRHLETFLKAADCGSFLKASEQLYISANAVTKQINLLEQRLGVRLFDRSTQGLRLTEPGRLIYDEAKNLIRRTESLLRRAKALEEAQQQVIRVGVSLMNPASALLERWGRASALLPNFRLEVVPFEDTVSAFSQVVENLGQKIDLISCPYQTNQWGDHFNSLHLTDLPMGVCCAKTHPLAQKPRLTLADLAGQTLVLMRRGQRAAFDIVRNDLERNCPEIHLKDAEYLDLPLFNQLASSSDLFLSAPCWQNVHPLLTLLPVDWPYTLPYGLIYPKEPAREVLQFIMAVGSVGPE